MFFVCWIIYSLPLYENMVSNITYSLLYIYSYLYYIVIFIYIVFTIFNKLPLLC